jgi:hypothetical protein
MTEQLGTVMSIAIEGNGREPVQRASQSSALVTRERSGTGAGRTSDIVGRRAAGDAAKASRGIATIAALLLASIASFSVTRSAEAQVSLGPTPGFGNTVCSVGGQLVVVVDDVCDPALTGVEYFSSSALTIGPSGSQTSFNSSTGAATFGSTSTFNASATFNDSATFNAGLTATTGTFSGMVTMNGGLTVGGGQTVDMGHNRVQNVGTPMDGTDATNKNYVDGLHGQQQTQINDIVTVNNQQNTRLTNVETVNTQQDTRLTALESGFAGQADQITAINNSIKSLSKRDGELADGIAIALALSQPAFQPGQKFAVRGGWGNFDGSNAFGVSAAGLLHSFKNGGSVILDVGGGMSTRHNMFAGRGGVTIGW